MMNIYISGINYRTTPLELREKLSFNMDEQKRALADIHKLPAVSECVILSTCNRTEVYIYCDSENFDNSNVEKLLCDIKGLSTYEFKKYFYAYSGVNAVKHLFKVASGLDSMVLGEDQILGQVKEAHDISLSAGTSSVVLNTLFREAVTAAKKVKTYTDLSRNSISVGSLAVKLLSDIFENKLEDKCALIIGLGKIGSIILKNLTSKGIAKIYVTNRSHGKVKDLSKIYPSVHFVDYNDRYSVVNECDIVISSTTSPHYTITRDMLEKSLTDIKQRVFIDLAVPRDIDIEIKELVGIKYFNIDHLTAAADENIDRRLLEATKAEQIIDDFVLEFEKWYGFRKILPVVKEVQKYTEEIVNDKINQTIAKLKYASDEDKDTVRASMANLVNGILNKFVYSVREYGSKEDIEAYFRCLSEVIKD
ncbi:MAG: glutamyl-tRNA reductase [Clostridia bacterium]|nr:glutamyl-tRNA reductase [Clostridia bacterium]